MRYFFTGTIIAAILTTAILMTFSLTETAFAKEGSGGGCGVGGCGGVGGSGSHFTGGFGGGGSDNGDGFGQGVGDSHCGTGSGGHNGEHHGGGSC
jgi:hypothetical protein